MQKTSGLGRGLGSLIPHKKTAVPFVDDTFVRPEILGDQEKISQLPVEKITPNPHQPRSVFNEDELQELMDSITEYGIIQPLIVSRSGDGWQLIAGERRWRSAKALGMATVPAIIRDMSEQKKMEIALIENLQRKDLNAVEVATAYQRLIDQFNLSHEELAKKVGKSRPAVANTLRILTAVPDVKKAVVEGMISEGHARVLVGLPEEDQLELLKKITIDSLNVRETEKAGRNVVVEKHIRKVAFNPELKAKEERLQQALGTKVEIKKSGDAGQIIIKFYSDEELEDIMLKIV